MTEQELIDAIDQHTQDLEVTAHVRLDEALHRHQMALERLQKRVESALGTIALRRAKAFECLEQAIAYLASPEIANQEKQRTVSYEEYQAATDELADVIQKASKSSTPEEERAGAVKVQLLAGLLRGMTTNGEYNFTQWGAMHGHAQDLLRRAEPYCEQQLTSTNH